MDNAGGQWWVLLLYKVAPQPTARRVAIWRKLKRLGALLLHDAVWVLPATPRTREAFQWLAGEIMELEGAALVWEAQLTLPGQAEQLETQFRAMVEPLYQEVLDALRLPAPDYAVLARRYQQIQVQDYVQSPLGQAVRAALLAAREEG